MFGHMTGLHDVYGNWHCKVDDLVMPSPTLPYPATTDASPLLCAAYILVPFNH